MVNFNYNPNASIEAMPRRYVAMETGRIFDGYTEVRQQVTYNKYFVYNIGGPDNVPNLYNYQYINLPKPYCYLLTIAEQSVMRTCIEDIQKDVEYFRQYKRDINTNNLIAFLSKRNDGLKDNNFKPLSPKAIECLAIQLFCLAPHFLSKVESMVNDVEGKVNVNNKVNDVNVIKKVKVKQTKKKVRVKRIKKLIRKEIKSLSKDISYKTYNKYIKENNVSITESLNENINDTVFEHIKHDNNNTKVVYVDRRSFTGDMIYTEIINYFPTVNKVGGYAANYFSTCKNPQAWRMKGCNAPYLLERTEVLKRSLLIQKLILGENCKLSPLEKEKALEGIFIIELDNSAELTNDNMPISKSIYDYYIHSGNVYSKHPITRDNTTLDMTKEKNKLWHSIVQNKIYKVTFIPESELLMDNYFVANTGDLLGLKKLTYKTVHPNSAQFNNIIANRTGEVGNVVNYVLNSHTPNLKFYRIDHKTVKSIESVTHIEKPEGLTIFETVNGVIVSDKHFELHDYEALADEGIYVNRTDAEYVLKNLRFRDEELRYKFREIDYKDNKNSLDFAQYQLNAIKEKLKLKEGITMAPLRIQSEKLDLERKFIKKEEELNNYINNEILGPIQSALNTLNSLLNTTAKASSLCA